MLERQTTWENVEFGMYLVGSDGSMWRCDERDTHVLRVDGWLDGSWLFRISNAAGERAVVTKRPEEPVTILVPTSEEAVRFVREGLGLAPHQVFELEKMPTRNTEANRLRLAKHLFHEHHEPVNPGSKIDTADMKALLELHDIAHARPRPSAIPHVHVH